MDASELRIADSVVNSGTELSQPDFPVFDANSGVEAEVGILGDAGIAGAVISLRLEKRRIVRTTRDPRSLAICRVRASSRVILRRRRLNRCRSAVAKCPATTLRSRVENRGSCLYGRVSCIWFSALEGICGPSLIGSRRGSGMRPQSRSGNQWRIPHVRMFPYGSSLPLFLGRRRLRSVQ